MAGHGVPRISDPKATANHGREEELRRIQNYRNLVDNVNNKMLERVYDSDVLDLTTKVLEANPEYYTVWNYRRLLLRSFFADVPESGLGGNPGPGIIQQYIVDDLAFLLPLLRKFPKCYWIWNYRLWLLDEASHLLPPAAAFQIWQKELALVGKMLSLDNRNFHGWGYRRRVVEELEKFSAKLESSSSSMTESEFNYTTKMIESNLSNFSAWHRRSKLIPKLLHERGANHRERRDFLEKDAIVPDLDTDTKLEYLKSMIEDLREMLEDAETCKWIYQRLLDLSLIGRRLTGKWPVEPSLAEDWIGKIMDLDPLRKGRWQDLKSHLAP
ncbi:MAG: hypothetical protein Q9219_003600 [cf. Caloplaca sp. 3 TL-2023]